MLFRERHGGVRGETRSRCRACSESVRAAARRSRCRDVSERYLMRDALMQLRSGAAALPRSCSLLFLPRWMRSAFTPMPLLRHFRHATPPRAAIDMMPDAAADAAYVAIELTPACRLILFADAVAALFEPLC